MDSNEKDDLLRIDLYRLEECCINNPVLMREWADKLAEAKRATAMADAQLKLVKAEMGKKIRQRPSAYGVVKEVEACFNDALIASKEHQEALMAKITADYEEDILKAMVDSIHERGKQLSNTAALHGQQYWSKPHTDPETRAGITEKSSKGTMAEVNAATSAARKKRN